MNRYTKQEKQLACFAKAMGHPTRIAILKILSSRNECFFGDIIKMLHISKSTISQHLSQLKNSGLIQGKIIHPNVKYSINRENWEQAKELFNELLNG